ncbi:MAG: hypothetical protein HND59_09150 [Pseudomonadota bacterium]|nr:MAG: hypothetical protein HND59_09150 [Pseudomonadota bacterium]
MNRAMSRLLSGTAMSMALLATVAALAETPRPMLPKKSMPSLQRPPVSKHIPIPRSTARPAPPPLAIPHTITTRPLEMIGNPKLPEPPEAFKPIAVTTAGLEMLGSPNPAPAVSETFTPVTVATDPLEMIGQPAQ